MAFVVGSAVSQATLAVQSSSSTPKRQSLLSPLAGGQTGTTEYGHEAEALLGTGDILCVHTQEDVELCRLGIGKFRCKLCIPISSVEGMGKLRITQREKTIYNTT